jgi:hypothetical protein
MKFVGTHHAPQEIRGYGAPEFVAGKTRDACCGDG